MAIAVEDEGDDTDVLPDVDWIVDSSATSSWAIPLGKGEFGVYYGLNS
jgi:hypothetical protein